MMGLVVSKEIFISKTRYIFNELIPLKYCLHVLLDGWYIRGVNSNHGKMVAYKERIPA